MEIQMPMMVVLNVKLIWDIHVRVQLALWFHLFVVMVIKVVQNNVMMVIKILEMVVLHYVLLKPIINVYSHFIYIILQNVLQYVEMVLLHHLKNVMMVILSQEMVVINHVKLNRYVVIRSEIQENNVMMVIKYHQMDVHLVQ